MDAAPTEPSRQPPVAAAGEEAAQGPNVAAVVVNDDTVSRSPARQASDDDDEQEGERPSASTDSAANDTDDAAAASVSSSAEPGEITAPPLPDEPLPPPEDDGWDCQWDPNSQAWFFANRFTGKTQWENPRVPTEPAAVPPADFVPPPPVNEKPPAGGYNPAIHGDYDPNAWYALGNDEDGTEGAGAGPVDPEGIYGSTATFNRFTGQFQSEDMGPGRHSDEAKSKRQMNAYFDVDAAANSHDGRSLRAERSNKKPSKAELKQFKEKRRARKEEKRRAWLRD
ncbi:hypothetical protein S40293_01907 [Stachybotrys chartarum IBT 40293]|nr:hypothetical protein S40293_01907 [Stachybotrys chartarum IBT 40293]